MSARGHAPATLRALTSARRSAVAAGALAGQRRFVGVRRHGDEGQAEALEQVAPIARRRRQHQRDGRASCRAGSAGFIVDFPEHFLTNLVRGAIIQRFGRTPNGADAAHARAERSECKAGEAHGAKPGNRWSGRGQQRVVAKATSTPCCSPAAPGVRRQPRRVRTLPRVADRLAGAEAVPLAWRIAGTSRRGGSSRAGRGASRAACRWSASAACRCSRGRCSSEPCCCSRATKRNSRGSTTIDEHEVVLASAPLEVRDAGRGRVVVDVAVRAAVQRTAGASGAAGGSRRPRWRRARRHSPPWPDCRRPRRRSRNAVTEAARGGRSDDTFPGERPWQFSRTRSHRRSAACTARTTSSTTPGARRRAGDRRSAPAPPHQPERLLSRQEGRQDQGRRVGRARPACRAGSATSTSVCTGRRAASCRDAADGGVATRTPSHS